MILELDAGRPSEALIHETTENSPSTVLVLAVVAALVVTALWVAISDVPRPVLGCLLIGATVGLFIGAALRRSASWKTGLFAVLLSLACVLAGCAVTMLFAVERRAQAWAQEDAWFFERAELLAEVAAIQEDQREASLLTRLFMPRSPMTDIAEEAERLREDAAAARNDREVAFGEELASTYGWTELAGAVFMLLLCYQSASGLRTKSGDAGSATASPSTTCAASPSSTRSRSGPS